VGAERETLRNAKRTTKEEGRNMKAACVQEKKKWGGDRGDYALADTDDQSGES